MFSFWLLHILQDRDRLLLLNLTKNFKVLDLTNNNFLCPHWRDFMDKQDLTSKVDPRTVRVKG